MQLSSLTIFITYHVLQAYARHLFGVDWEYHHNLGLINRTSFLLNYLSDTLDGAKAYADWINGDLYEESSEQFGICIFPGKPLIYFLIIRSLSNNRSILRATPNTLRNGLLHYRSCFIISAAQCK